MSLAPGCFIVAAFFTVSGCASPSSGGTDPNEQAPSEITSPTAPPSAVDPAADRASDPQGAPASAARVRPLLLARHTKDLPDRVVLDRHEGAELGLGWLAEHDGLMAVRERALYL